MLNIKKFLKGLRILNEADQTKAVELNVSSSATTGTKAILSSRQTANRTNYLPDSSGDLINDTGTADLTNKTISLSNTTDNKLLVSEATTHKVVDSTITHVNNAGDTELTVSGGLKITANATKVVVLQGKAVRLPIANFNPSSLPSGNRGDAVYNQFDEAIWYHNGTSYIALIGDAGADRKLANLIAPTEVNAALIPNTNGMDLGTAPLRWDAFLENVDVNAILVNDTLQVDGSTILNDDVVINGNLTVNGTMTTVDSQTLAVADANITVNSGGNDASAEGAGLTIDRTGTDGSLVYQNSLASKFKVGALGSESEVITAGTTQTITGEKSISALLNLPSYNDSTTNTVLTIAGGAVVRITNSKTIINEIAGLSSGSYGLIINASSGNITFKNQDGTVGTATNRIQTANNADYVIAAQDVVHYYYDSVIQRTRITAVAIADASITAAKLASSSVTSAKLDTDLYNRIVGVVSSELTLPANNADVSFPHGLGAVPSRYSVVLRCKTFDIGYNAGEEIDITSNLDGDGTRTTTSLVSSTFVAVRSSVWSSYYVENRSAPSSAPITPANWKIVLRAWL